MTELSMFDDTPRVTDEGVFLFRAQSNGVDDEAAAAAIVVTVTDEDGAEVPGNLWVLKSEGAADGIQTLTLSWQTTGEPRRDGEVLALHASATNSVGSTEIDATLTVKSGTHPEVPPPELLLSAFDEVLRDVGVREECVGVSDCGGTWFGKELATHTRMELVMSVPHPEVMVAWEFELQQVSGKGNFLDRGRTLEAFEPVPDYVEHLHFSDVLDEYCIRVQGNDLRNGGSEIVEFCASPVRPLATLSLDAIGNCSEPPPAQHERWCRAPDHEEVRTTAQLAECERLLGTGEGGSAGEASSSAGGSGNGGSGARGPSAGGDGGRAQTGGNGGRSPTGGSNGAGTGATGTPEPAETAGSGSEETDDAGGTQRVLTDGGCGCRTAGDPSRPYGALALAGLFALAARLGFRRRRRGAVG